MCMRHNRNSINDLNLSHKLLLLLLYTPINELQTFILVLCSQKRELLAIDTRSIETSFDSINIFAIEMTIFNFAKHKQSNFMDRSHWCDAMAIRCLFFCFLNKKYHLVGTFRWEAKKYDTVLSLFPLQFSMRIREGCLCIHHWINRIVLQLLSYSQFTMLQATYWICCYRYCLLFGCSFD